MNYEVIDTHIDNIKPGDTVEHNGKKMTVCRSDIKRGTFMGTTLFGDSYRLGRLPVKKVNIQRAMPGKSNCLMAAG